MTNPFKTKSIPVAQRTRDEKLAAAFYFQHASPEDRREVETILRKEGWKGAGKKLLGTYERGSVSPLGGTLNYPKGHVKVVHQYRKPIP